MIVGRLCQTPSSKQRLAETPYNNCALDVRRWALDVCFMTQVQVQDDRLTAIRAAFPKEGLFAEKEWLLSPDAFPIGKKFLADLEQLGHRLSVFQRACNQLYHLSVKGRQPAWIARYLDAGKPKELIEFSRRWMA